MEPVDPKEAPDYYKVIKEPMGKLSVKKKFFEIKIKNYLFPIRSQTDGNQTRIKHVH